MDIKILGRWFKYGSSCYRVIKYNDTYKLQVKDRDVYVTTFRNLEFLLKGLDDSKKVIKKSLFTKKIWI